LGDALAFCDADDEVGPGWVGAMGEALFEHDFVAGRLETNKLNEAWVAKTRHPVLQEQLPVYPYPPFLPFAASANLGIKRSLHHAVGGFDETWKILEETDYCFRIQLKGIKLHFLPESIVYYRYRDSFMGIYRQARDYGEYNVRLRKKYRSPGTHKNSLKAGVKQWIRIFRNLPKIRQKADFGRWIWTVGGSLGRVKGSIKHGVIDL
jgi:GT2 family glycosyltransferase